MDYNDWNLPEPLKPEAEKLGWAAHSPLCLTVRHPGEWKQTQSLCSVWSESSELLRQASKRCKLIDPTGVRGFEKDAGLVRAVSERGAFFELPLRPLLHEWGAVRAARMARYKDFLALCEKRSAKIVFASHAQSVFDLKSPFEVKAILRQLNLSAEQATALLKREVPG